MHTKPGGVEIELVKRATQIWGKVLVFFFLNIYIKEKTLYGPKNQQGDKVSHVKVTGNI